MARAALRRGDTAPAVLNAANEVAVKAFLDGQLKFLCIAALVEATLEEAERQGAICPAACLDDILAVDGLARRWPKKNCVAIKIRGHQLQVHLAPPRCSPLKDCYSMDYLATLATWIWQYGIMFLLVLTLVVFVHELGHFLIARWCGVTVKAFSIGFGPEIYGFYDKHGTRWRFAWIPLGGYVKFIDDENPASQRSVGAEKRMTPAERAGRLPFKVGWSESRRRRGRSGRQFSSRNRALFGPQRDGRRARHAGLSSMPVVANSPAARAGFQAGDRIVAIDNDRNREI